MGLKIFRKNNNFVDKDKILEVLKSGSSTSQGQSLAIVDDESSGTLSILASQGKLWQLVSSVMSIKSDRQSRYADYDEMSEDGFIQSALELYTDDVTQYSQEVNATIWPSSDHDYCDDIYELFSKIGVEESIWGWAWNIAKYGDFFVGINAREGEGVISLEESIHPKNLNRVDINGKLAGFLYVEDGGGKTSLLSPASFVHFVNNYRPNFESVKMKILRADYEKYLGIDYKSYNNQDLPDIDQIRNNIKMWSNREDNNDKKIIKNYLLNESLGDSFSEDGEYVIKRITSKYGTSIFQSARQVYKLLNLLEAMLAMARISRTPLIRVYYVNTTGMTPKERRELTSQLEEKFSVKKAIDIPNNFYKERYYPAGFNDDIFIPYSGDGRGDVKLESIGGEVNIKDIVDIEYLRDKLFASLRIPKSFMGFDESVPGVSSNTSLTRLDIRYARGAKKIQRSLIEGVYRLCDIHLSYKYGTRPDLTELGLSMYPISSAEEDSRLSILNNKISLFSSYLDAAEKLKDKGVIDYYYFTEYLVKNVLNLPGLDVDKLFLGNKDMTKESLLSSIDKTKDILISRETKKSKYKNLDISSLSGGLDGKPIILEGDNQDDSEE
jgi:hypothetical protein